MVDEVETLKPLKREERNTLLALGIVLASKFNFSTAESLQLDCEYKSPYLIRSSRIVTNICG